MVGNTIVASGSSPPRARVAGFWPVNEGELEMFEVPMLDTAVFSKGELLMGHASGYAVDASSPTSINVLGVTAEGGGSSVAGENADVPLMVWVFDTTTRYWVIASTGTAGIADYARSADIDGNDGISVSARPVAGSGSVGFRILQIDDTYDVCMGHFEIH